MTELNNNRRKNTNVLDVLRGLAIIDMMLVHYIYLMPSFLAKTVMYHDVAIDGFILISGYTTGRFLLPLYCNSLLIGAKKSLNSSFRIFILSTILVCSVGLAEFLITNNGNKQQISEYLIDTTLALNQVGLLHILPTFFYLFLISIILLTFISRGLDWFVVLISIILFLIGRINLDLFFYKEVAIFPITLWQSYFVIGILLGKYNILESIKSKNINAILFFLVVFFILMLFVRHANVLNLEFYNYLVNIGSSYQKFPLNHTGLVFGLSFWCLLSVMITKFWSCFVNFRIISFLSRIGRNALFVFFIHVIIAKIAEILLSVNNIYLNLALFLSFLNVIIYIYLLPYYENWLSKKNNNPIKIMFKWVFR